MKLTNRNPVKIVFAQSIAGALKSLLQGRKCWVITTPGMVRRGVFDQIQKETGDLLSGVCSELTANPTFGSVVKCAQKILPADPELLIALGGGSVLDTAKAIAALKKVVDPKAWLDRIIRGGQAYPQSFYPTPVIAIPTTAGTGSEVTMWGSLWDMHEKKKYSISHPKLYPESALMIPQLTDTLSYEQSLFPALDALSHSMEAIWNKNASSISDELALETISILAGFLKDDYSSRYTDPGVRAGVQSASLRAGIASSYTQTAIAHSISYPLTAHLNVPHGLACSFTLAEVMRFNSHVNSKRMGEIVEALGASSLSEAINRLYQIYQEIGVGIELKRLIARRSDATNIQTPFITPERARNNLAPVSEEEAVAILDAALAALGIPR